MLRKQLGQPVARCIPGGLRSWGEVQTEGWKVVSQLGLRSNSVAEWVVSVVADWAAAPRPGRYETLVDVERLLAVA